MGTLVTEPFDEDVPAFFGLPMDELYAAKDDEPYLLFEKGQIGEEEYCARFFRDRREVDMHGLKATIARSVQWMAGVEPLLAELKGAGYAMHALSNYSIWYRLIEAKLEVERFVEWTFVSCHTGLRKPDREAYLAAARSLGVAPSSCVFVDDRQVNVAAAAKVGMHAILRTPDIAVLRRDLNRASILR
jgi:HAD superfamily hydrolase (TIGR01509 family)